MGSQAKLEPSLVQSESVLYGVQYNGTKIPVLAVGVSILSDMFTLLVFPGPPDPIVPVTVKVYVPGVAVEPTFTVSVDVAESPGLGPGVTELGEKEVVTPLGTLEEDRVTGIVIPPSESVTVIVGLLELPCMIVSELGDEDMLNGGICPNAFSPDMLTAAISYPAAIWTENSTAPYNLMFGTDRISWTANTGILQPLYSDPFNFQSICHTVSCFNWNPVNVTKNAYPHVPYFVVVNPGNGPCGSVNGFSCPDPRYQQAIANLTKSGVIVLGYVWGDNVTSPNNPHPTNLAWVEGNVTNWTNWYSSKNTTMGNLGIKGIFLDGMPNGVAGNETYYRQITKFIHTNESLAYSFANPGFDNLQSYQGTVDLMTIHENTNLPTNTTLQGNDYLSNPKNWHTLFDKSTYSYLAFCQPNLVNSTYVQGTSLFVGYLYPLDQHGCGGADSGPWSIIPPQSWLNTLTGYINNVPVQSTIQAKDKSGNPISVPIQIYQSGKLVRNSTTPFTFNETSGWKFNFTSTTICKWTYGSASSLTHSIIVGPNASITFTATNGTPPC